MVKEDPGMLMQAVLDAAFTWLCRRRKGWPNEGSLFDLISLLPMMPIEPLERGWEFLGFEIDSLLSSGIPVQFLEPTRSPLPSAPAHTPQWSAIPARSKNNGPVRPASQDARSYVGQQSLGIESAMRSLVRSCPGKKAF